MFLNALRSTLLHLWLLLRRLDACLVEQVCFVHLWDTCGASLVQYIIILEKWNFLLDWILGQFLLIILNLGDKLIGFGQLSLGQLIGLILNQKLDLIDLRHPVNILGVVHFHIILG